MIKFNAKPNLRINYKRGFVKFDEKGFLETDDKELAKILETSKGVYKAEAAPKAKAKKVNKKVKNDD